MTDKRIPKTVSHECLLAALDSRAHAGGSERSLYETQLRHRLSVLSRKLRLIVAAQQVTGIKGQELIGMSTEQLLALLDTENSSAGKTAFDLFRYFW